MDGWILNVSNGVGFQERCIGYAHLFKWILNVIRDNVNVVRE